MDAASDASADGGPSYPECSQGLTEIPALALRAEAGDRTDVDYPLIVVESTELRFRAEEGGLPVDDRDPYVDIEFPYPLRAEVSLPRIGDPILARGGSCDYMLGISYVRLMTPDGQVFLEGGSPNCADVPGRSLWDPDPYLGARDRPGAETCSEVLEACCCRDRTEHDVIVHPDGDSVLVRGEDRVVEIDGASYFASSQGVYLLEVTPCTMLHSGVKGSAFLARMSE